MKKIILITSLIFFVISCNIENKEIDKQDTQIKENNIQNKTEEKNFSFYNIKEKKNGPIIDTKLNQENGLNVLTININGKDYIIEKTKDKISNRLVFQEGFIIYDVIGKTKNTKIYDFEKQKIIGELPFGKREYYSKYYYSCTKNNVSYFNTKTKLFYSYNKQLGIGEDGKKVYDCYFDYMNDILYFKFDNKSYSLNMNKNELRVINKLIDIKKYSKEDQPAIELINNSIFLKKLQENQKGELKIIKTYNYFDPKQNKNLTRVVYAKDDNNYYYLCMDLLVCDETFEKHPIQEGKLEIIDKHNYKIGNKKYLNKYEEGFKKMQEDRLKKQKIIKDYGNGLILKQDTEGFMYDELGQTILYLNGKELISLANNLLTINCDKKGLNICKGEKITDDFIRRRTAEKFEILKNGKDVFIDKNSNIRVLYIWQYEGHDTYFIDLKNEKIIKDESGMDYFIKKVIQGKSGTFVLGKGGKGCGGGLIFISNEGKISYLFKNNCDEDLDETFQEIIDFELLFNKQVKIFYKGHNGENKEKIIKLK